MATPSWQKHSTARREQLTLDYKTNLKIIAESIASYQENEVVLETHVEQAHETLAKAGLSDTPWYQRTEFRSGLAGLIVGGSFSISDVINLAPLEENHQLVIARVLFIVMLILGIALFVYTAFSSRLPKTLNKKPLK